MSNCEIRICGLGGQGVILAGIIMGRAASIHEDRFATLIQSFGPEARGSDCSAQIMLSDSEIVFPYIRNSDVFMAFSQSAYAKFVKEMKEGAILVYDSELVKPDDQLPKGVKKFGMPGTHVATKEFGKRIVFNLVMLGFFTAVTSLVGKDAMRNAVADSVPKGTEDMNLKAFDRGFSCGQEQLSK